ncbi:MAG: hypothetical protein ACXAAH_08750 [Promethearchaeota archaeon]|jgi:hypothetical protein
MKSKKWLPDNNYLENLSPKEHYNNTFKIIIRKIKDNEKSIREGIICPFCYERNIGIKKFCYKCGKKLKQIPELFPS